MRRVLALLALTGCFGRLELDGEGGPLYGGPFDEQQAEALWLEIAAHDEWPALPGYEGRFENAPPHGSSGSLHVNAIASNDPRRLPIGSVIVKRDYEDDLTAITVVKRIDHFNPDARDWFWAKFRSDGLLEMDEDGLALAGAIDREGGCIACHAAAPGEDFVFLNGAP